MRLADRRHWRKADSFHCIPFLRKFYLIMNHMLVCQLYSKRSWEIVGSALTDYVDVGRFFFCGKWRQKPIGYRRGQTSKAFRNRIFFLVPRNLVYATHGCIPVFSGFFEFRLCVHNDVNSRVSQHCLDKTLLVIEEGEHFGHPNRFFPSKFPSVTRSWLARPILID